MDNVTSSSHGGLPEGAEDSSRIFSAAPEGKSQLFQELLLYSTFVCTTRLSGPVLKSLDWTCCP